MEESNFREIENNARPDASPAVRARRELLESLRLSRSRTLAQLERATGQAHREMLTRTLRALEREMAELG
jgi:hypothetical protein